jgi:serine/threonine protein kinase
MNASTDLADMDESSSIAADVRMRLDTYVRGECDVETLAPAMSAFCKAAPDAAWEVLAILDQYHRRGELDEDLFQSLKTSVNRIAFGLREDAVPSSPPPAATPVEKAPPTIRRQPEISVESVDEEDEEEDAAPLPAAPVRQRTEPFKVAAAEAAELSQPLSPGDVLRDRYVIETVLAYGQSSAVFKAYDRHRANFAATGCYVAIKVLHTSATAEIRARFEQEFQLVQRITHPNVVKVFDLDRDEQRLFFTMELIEGQTLGHLLERSPPRRAQALEIIRQVGSALAYMHDHSVVHGDVSPENIMVTHGGAVKLLDFGSAVMLTREPWISTVDARTAAKAAVYASCERLEGMPAEKRDDVYSLACVAYELLTGEHPFFRQFATRARDSKQRPRRARELSSRQWRNLLQGLAWTREQRPAVRTWLAGMDVDIDNSAAAATSAPQTASPYVYAGVNLAVALAVIGFVFLRWDFDTSKTPAWLVSGQITARQAISQIFDRASSPAAVSSASKDDVAAAAPAGASQTFIGRSPAEEVISAPPAAPAAADKSKLATDNADSANDDGEKKIVDGPGYIGFTKDTFFVKKTDSAARITVRRAGGNARAASFIWWAEPGTAEADKDYISLGRKTEHLPVGDRDLVVFVPIVSGVKNNAGEIFFVELEPLDNASPGRITRARVVLSGE